jgi:WD40 repeat protein
MNGMRKYLAFAFLLFLFRSGVAFEPELMYQIPIADKTAGGDVLGGKLILSSPDKLSVLTPEGKEAFEVDLGSNQGVVISKDGEFFGITTYSKDAPPGFLAAQKFELYSADGKRLWEVANPEASAFYVSNGAKLIIGISGGEGSPESRLVFYSHTGDVISNAKVAFLQGVSFSSDGRHVFISGAKDGLLAFDDSGNLAANFGRCEQFATSSDGEHVATVTGGDLKLHHQGKPTGDPLEVNPLVREMSFSPGNRYLVVIDRKNLSLFEVETGKLVWRHTLDRPELSFISTDLSSNAETIIAGIDLDKGREVPPEERHTEGLVWVFDKTGKIVWEEELSYKLWSSLFPRVKLSADGKKLSVTTREKISVYELSQSEQ